MRRAGIEKHATYLKVQPKDTDGLLPDVPVRTTWADYRAGRDPVLVRALK